jgi:histidinol-phosphatase (PHP family)
MKQRETTMIDYHVHPNYSMDAKGTLEEFCDSAISKGIQEIAFTTHVDADLETEDCFVLVEGERIHIQSDRWVEHYEASIRTIGDKYKERGLLVKLGAELDLYPGVAEVLPERFFQTDFDFIIGSVHLIEHKAISLREEAEEIFTKYSVEELGEIYFSMLFESIDISLFNILGHIDIYRRYGEAFYGHSIHTLWKPHLKELASKMRKYNVGFEINTSAWRKGQNEPMPAKLLTKALIEQGVDTITVGSDAHKPQDVGDGIKRAIELLKQLGVKGPSGFSKKKSYTLEF